MRGIYVSITKKLAIISHYPGNIVFFVLALTLLIVVCCEITNAQPKK
jgi:hypothetical protein